MLVQLDKHSALIAGTIVKDPVEGKDKNGRRMIRLMVAYGYVREGNGFVRLELPVIVSGYYTSYARLAVKGDCLLAIGKKEVLPDGQKENTLFVSRYQCGYINVVGTMDVPGGRGACACERGERGAQKETWKTEETKAG